MNEQSSVYYLVVAGANPPTPSSTDVKNQFSTYGAASTAVKQKGCVGCASGVVSPLAASTELNVDLDATTGTAFADNEVLSVFVVAEDAAGNLQATPTKVDVIMGDDTAPTYGAGYPYADQITATGFDLLIQLNEAGTSHYAILDASDPSPTAAEIIAGSNANAVACSKSAGVYVPAVPYSSPTTYDVRHAVTSYAEASLAACLATYGAMTAAEKLAAGLSDSDANCRKCPHLQGSGSYKVYVLSEDDNAANGAGSPPRVNNVQTLPQGMSFTLDTVDTTPPSFDPSASSPDKKNLATTSVDLSVSSNEIGNAYYLVVPAGSAAPTAAQVKSQVSSYGVVTVVKKGTWAVPATQTEADVTVTGLNDLTSYVAYVILEDTAKTNTATNVYASASNVPNVQATATAIAFTTTDGTPPTFAGAFKSTVHDIAGTSFKITAQLDEPGDAFYIAIPRTTDSPPSPGPTAAEVIAASYAGVVACGTFAVAAAATNATATVTTTSDPLGANAASCASGGVALPPSAAKCAACPLVDSESRYWVYVTARDDETSPNVMTTTRVQGVDTVDVTAPTFQNSHPTITGNAATTHKTYPNIGGVTLNVTVELDEPGKVYFLATAAADAAPTSAQVKACGVYGSSSKTSTVGHTYTPSGGSAIAPFACGDLDVQLANTAYVHRLTEIPEETAVKVYVVAEDDENTRLNHFSLLTQPPVSNLQATPANVAVTTVDTSPPEWATVAAVKYPRVPYALATDIEDVKATFDVAVDEPGTVYYVVVTKDLTFHEGYTDGTARALPTTAEVRAGTGPGALAATASGSVAVASGSENTKISTVVTGLAAQTAYDVYLVAEDDAPAPGPNVQTSVTKLRFKTRDNTAPVLSVDASTHAGPMSWTKLGGDIDGEAAGDVSGSGLSFSSDGTIVAVGTGFNDDGGADAGHVRVYKFSSGAWTQMGGDIDGEAAGDKSGFAVSLSSDGTIVAVGAYDNDDGGADAGHVRVYQFAGGAWTQMGGDIDGEAAGDRSGQKAVSLSSDGTIVAVGAVKNDGTGADAGHVRVFQFSSGAWTQMGADIDGEAAGDQSGNSVSLSSDGKIMAIGAPKNDGTGADAGHVRVYQFSSGAWTQMGADIDGEAAGDEFGDAVSLSSDGTIVAIGALKNDGTGGDAGHVRVYQFSSGAWTQMGADIDGEATDDQSGSSVSLSSDGTIVAVGAYANDDGGANAGHVRLYQYSSGAWTQMGADIDGDAAGDQAGQLVALSGDGKSVAVAGPYTDSNGANAGRVRVFCFGCEYPKAIMRGTSMGVEVMMDEPGQAWYIVVPDGTSPGPTSAEVIANTFAAAVGTTCGHNSSTPDFQIPSANVPYVCNVTGLSDETEYDVYVVVADDVSNDPLTGDAFPTYNALAAPVKIDVKTLDVTPPRFAAAYPKVDNVDGTSFDLKVLLDEIGIVYYTVDNFNPADGVIVPPSPAQVKAGTNQMGKKAFAHGNVSAPTASTEAVKKIEKFPGLISERDYYVYTVAEDLEDVPNLQTTLGTRIRIRTPDVTPPTFKTRAVQNVKGDRFDVVTSLNEIGFVYYVVLPKGATAPTAAKVRLMQNAAGVSTTGACGVFYIPSKDANVTETVISLSSAAAGACAAETPGLAAPSLNPTTGVVTNPPFCNYCPQLSSATAYDVYVVAEDDGGHGIPNVANLNTPNLQENATLLSHVGFTAAANGSVITADVTPPTFTSSTPAVDKFDEHGFNVKFELNEPGVVHYTAMQSTGVTCATSPTHRQVRAGTNGCDHPANATGNVTIPVASTPVTVTVRGIGNLTREEDAYVLTYFADDDEPTGMSALTAPNPSAIATTTKSTADRLPPLHASSYPKANNPVSTTGFGAITTKFDVVVNADEIGTAHYVAFPAWHRVGCHPADAACLGGTTAKQLGLPGYKPPTAAQIKAGKDWAGATAAVKGSWAISSANADATTTTTADLDDVTDYNVYVAVEDDAGADARVLNFTAVNNLNPNVTVANVTTADGTAPLFTGNPCESRLHEECSSQLRSESGRHSQYPRLHGCSNGGFDLRVSVDEAGSTVHYVVVGYDTVVDITAAVDPTNVQVKAGGATYTPAGAGATPVTIVHAGAVSAAAAKTPYSSTVTFTLPASNKFYQVFTTTEGPNGNLGDGDVRRTDNVNPTKVAPCVAQSSGGDLVTFTVGETTLKADVFLTAPANVYYVLLRAGSPTPTPTQILNGKDSYGSSPPCYDYVHPSDASKNVRCYFADTSLAATAGVVECADAGMFDDGVYAGCTLATFTNLTRGDSFDVHLVTTHVNGTILSDQTGPDSAAGAPVYYDEFSRVGEKATARTKDAQAPFFAPGYPKVVDVKGTTATLSAKLDEPGKMYWILDETGNASPTTAEVKAGTAAAGAAVLASGSVVAATVDNAAAPYSDWYDVALTGLNPKSSYDVFIVAEDDGVSPYGGNEQALPTKVTFSATSTDAHLGALGVRTVDANAVSTALALRPAFSQTTFAYQVFVDVDVDNVKFTPSSNDTESANSIYVNGTQRLSQSEFSVSVPHGKTTYEFVVTAGDGATRKTYVVAVTRAVNDAVTNASIVVLDVEFNDGTTVNSTLMGGKPWPKCVKGCNSRSSARCSAANPDCVMDAAQTKYVVRVPSEMTTLKVKAQAARPTQSTMRVYTKGTSGVDYPGGLPGYTTGAALTSVGYVVNLYQLAQNGGNTIDVVVTAGDQSTKKTYTIVVERFGVGVYNGWSPVRASAPAAAADDTLTTRVGIDPTVRDLTVLPSYDTTAPSFVSSYPRAGVANNTSVEIAVQLDVPGVAYYLVLPDYYRAPTSREVKAGSALRSDAVAHGVITSLRGLTQETLAYAYGLTSATDYDLYVVAEDMAKDLRLEAKPNLQTVPFGLNVSTTGTRSWKQWGGDIDGEAAGDVSGSGLSFSSDGTVVAVGTGFNDDGGADAGHVRVYKFSSGAWTQMGADIDGEAAADKSGFAVSLSSDGTIVAVGAGFNDDSAIDAGHVRVYQYVAGAWTQMGADIDGEAFGDKSGQNARAVSLSSDGTIVAVGANRNDGTGGDAGHVRVFQFSSGAWTQMGGDIDGEAAGDQSGFAVSLSSDGTIVAVGAPKNDGTGADAGHVRVYQFSSGAWTQMGADIDGEAAGDEFGISVSLSSDGTIMAVGAYKNDGTGANAGHVRVYQFSSGAWTQMGADVDGEATDDQSGHSVSLSSDGTIVAVGAYANDDGGADAGHVRLYQYSSGAWTQMGADIDGDAAGDQAGQLVALSGDGRIVAVAGPYTDSNGSNAGRVRVYKY